VRGGLELAEQIAASGQDFAAVVLASGSAGTHAGLALALESARPGTRVIGVTVSRSEAAQKPKVEGLLQRTAELLGVEMPHGLNLELWDAYFAPRYGEANAAGLEAISLLARLEAILLDPVYTGKAFAGLLDAAKKLHAKGTPIGMTLGHASGDGRSTNYPVLWAFGGKEFEADGRTVAINSPGTLAAVEWYKEIYQYFIPGTTAWLDPDNNQAFLASKVSATVNVNTIYLASRAAAATDAARKNIVDNMDHANWPAGPAGRFANYNINVWLPFASSPNKAGQREFLKAWYSRTFLPKWTKVGQSYFIPQLAGFDSEDVWPEDPKLKIFRDLNKINRLPGYGGPPTPVAAEAVNKYILVDMFAKACTGQLTPRDAVAWAEKEYQQIARRRSRT
jgi:hypothetical protein